ncbi:MAG: sulfotransferase domain-containing protein [Planctomycetes bacterium]|nr:sulfotransferase domain-containing protein [Planctomycetota bacterium]
MADTLVSRTPQSSSKSVSRQLWRRVLLPLGLGAAGSRGRASTSAHDDDASRALGAAMAQVARGAGVAIGAGASRAVQAMAQALRGRDLPLHAIGAEDRPGERDALLRTAVATRCAEQLRVIDLPAAGLAASWHEPIGLLRLDAATARADFESWYPHVVAGGILAIDEGELGTLVPSRRLRVLARAGGLVLLQKLEALRPSPRATRRVLVVCDELHAAGGLLRFERVGRELARRGDSLAYLPLGDATRRGFATQFPVLRADEAFAQRFDATMVPGQGFPAATIRDLARFREPRFGQRIQHVLNDRSLRAGFLAVNEAFAPHAVVFNCRDWAPGSFTDFAGDRFLVLEGAVDATRFAVSPIAHEGYVIGGLCKPALRAFWREFASAMPAGWRLRLFGAEPGFDAERVEHVGRLDEAALPGFYAGLDAVVHAERFAGWANVVAEAMAAGVPVVCSRKGTQALALAGETAHVIEDDALDAGAAPFVAAVQRLAGAPDEARAIAGRARAHVARFDWSSYAERLREFAVDDGCSHYTLDPARGMYGKWPEAERLQGLEGLLAGLRGQSVLDLGCAEGIVARACLDHGAEAVHGFELDATRIATCRRIAPEPRALFLPGSVAPWQDFATRHAATLRSGYDVVLHLGLHHHLPPRERRAVLLGALARCRHTFALRTQTALFASEKLDELLRGQGFVLEQTVAPANAAQGQLRIYRRTDPVALPRELRFVSFPKSGRTWMRFALTQLGVADAVIFEHDGFEYNDGTRPALDFDASARWDKCHRADRVVYMSRDPRDTIVSLFHQVTGRFRDFFAFEGTIAEFIRDPYFGAENLAGFQRMWRGAVDAGLAVRVRYEDAHRDFAGVLRTVLDAFGIVRGEAEIAAAATAARFSNMKELEQSGEFAEPWLRTRNAAPKVRRGQVGGFRDELDEADQRWLATVFGALVED